jgi:hypothetical protein
MAVELHHLYRGRDEIGLVIDEQYLRHALGAPEVKVG